MSKREEDREINIPIERESEMETFYIQEAREHRMRLRGWFAFLLQERFKVQTGKIAYSPYWQVVPPVGEIHPQKNPPPKETSRSDFNADPEEAFRAFGFDDGDDL